MNEGKTTTADLGDVSVVVPAWNCADALRAHLELLGTVYGARVKEFVCVDSGSKDGSREIFQEFQAKFPNCMLLDHPPGLYESWNHAIRHTSGKFVLVSTVGDHLVDGGLEHLRAVAKETAADVVISPPQMVGEDGGESEVRWPVHVLVKNLFVDDRPRKLRREEWAFWFHAFLPGGALGSSAGNLYSGDYLRANLFPAEYGRAGDTAWSLLFPEGLAVVVTPRVCSRFVITDSGGGKKSATEQRALFHRLADLSSGILQKEPFGEIQDLNAVLTLLRGAPFGMFDWLAQLEEAESNAAATVRDQTKYIAVLENEVTRLKQEIEALGNVPFLGVAPPLKVRHLGPLLRRLGKLEKK